MAHTLKIAWMCVSVHPAACLSVCVCAVHASANRLSQEGCFREVSSGEELQLMLLLMLFDHRYCVPRFALPLACLMPLSLSQLSSYLFSLCCLSSSRGNGAVFPSAVFSLLLLLLLATLASLFLHQQRLCSPFVLHIPTPAALTRVHSQAVKV